MKLLLRINRKLFLEAPVGISTNSEQSYIPEIRLNFHENPLETQQLTMAVLFLFISLILEVEGEFVNEIWR
jgi:hypothetical protein